MSDFILRDPSLLVLALALAIDAFVGEPPTPLHPVVGMGRIIRFLERRAPTGGVFGPLVFGAFLAVAVPSGLALLTSSVLERLRGLEGVAASVLSLAVSAVLLKSMFAARALGQAAEVVRGHLAAGRLDDARHGLRSLCSRDPSRLDPPLVAAAAIESLAENTADSVVAPLLYYALFGLPGAVFYRAVNTLDSMIGYHGKYEYLGKASARLDDALNFVPARVTAALLLFAGWMAKKDVSSGVRILARDGAKTESPNAGRPMATMAGLLGVQLEKVGHYVLGDARSPVSAEHIDEAWRVVRFGVAATALLVAAGMSLAHGP